MKKKIILLLLLLTTSVFAKWETVSIKDEFGEDTGLLQMFNFFKEGRISITPPYEAFPSTISISTKNFISNDLKEVTIKFKNEKNELLVTTVYGRGAYVVVMKSLSDKEFDEIINFFKKSKNIKIAIPGYEKNILLNIDSNNFNEIFPLIKNKL